MSIKLAIFTVESLAHMQGREKDMLPIVEAARKEHEALLECSRLLAKAYENQVFAWLDDEFEVRQALKKLENLK